MSRGFLIDMDGVIYRGSTMIPGADVFVNSLIKNDVPFLFITNHSRLTQRDLQARLKGIGISVDEKHIYTSAMATGTFLAHHKPNGRAFVLGEGGLTLSLHQNGYSIVDHNPDYVVVGEGRNFTLEMIEKAIDFILDGAKLVVTNMDPSPRLKEFSKPGIRAIVKLLEEATGKIAFSVGKPSPIMMRGARKYLDLRTAETVIIGDTLETDILAAIQMGYRSVLVLSGASTTEDLAKQAFKPDLVLNSIADLKWDMEF
jgi:NagD protein